MERCLKRSPGSHSGIACADGNDSASKTKKLVTGKKGPLQDSIGRGGCRRPRGRGKHEERGCPAKR